MRCRAYMRNHTGARLSVVIDLILLACVAIHTAACAPDVALKAPHHFTDEAVKLALWNDRCDLQSFFDSKPAYNMVVQDQGWTERLVNGHLMDRGIITVRVSDRRQLRMFRSLLKRYYRTTPLIRNAKSYDVTVRYVRYCTTPRMATGSRVWVRVGDQEVSLAYHPCMGNFLLNRDLYRTRAALVAKGTIETRVASKEPDKGGNRR